MNEMYQKMVAAGIDMSWYDKSKGVEGSSRTSPPLTEDHCGRLSIYLLEPNGNLYTTVGDGNRYQLVRYTESRQNNRVYVCACCKQDWPTFAEARQHFIAVNTEIK